MAKFSFKELVSDGDIITAKIGSDTVANSGNLVDNDIGKPVKLSAADTYNLCSDGDLIDGFLIAVEPYTADGWAIGSVQIGGRKRVELDVACAIGNLVEAGTMAAAGTAEANGLGVVSIKSDVAADLATDASGTLIAASVNAVLAAALLPPSRWRLISGTGLDEDTTAIVEKI